MLRFLIVALALCATAYGGALRNEARIVGGEEANITAVPYQLAMLYSRTGSGFSLVCGASLISTRFVISAASCFTDTIASQWRARGGSKETTQGGLVVQIDRIISHERFGTVRFDFDLSLIVTAAPFGVDDITIANIFLPAQNQTIDDGTVGVISGWGATREGGSVSGVLRKTNVPVVNQQLCQNAYGGGLVTDNMICLGNYVTGGIDACSGDQGGPFQVNGQLIAVSSWGNGCGRPLFPGVWTRVARFRNWIEANIPQNFTLDDEY